MKLEKIEKAVNIACGCLLGSPLPNADKTEIMDVLRYMEERLKKQEDYKSFTGYQVTSRTAMDEWVAGGTVIAIDINNKATIIESYEKQGLGCVANFPIEGVSYYIKEES